MNINNLKLTAMLSLLALAGFASSASADVITINFNDPLPGDFVWDDITTNMGNCPTNDAPCMQLIAGPGQTKGPYTLSRSEGGTFSLDGFWFQLLGAPAILRVAGTGGIDFTAVFADPDFVHNTPHNFVTTLWAGITSITFSNTGTGNIRVDDLTVTYDYDPPVDPMCPAGSTGVFPNCTPDPVTVTVPEPGTLGLLGIGLLGLGMRRRRKV